MIVGWEHNKNQATENKWVNLKYKIRTNKVVKANHFITASKAHQTSIKFPIMHKSIRINPYKHENELSPNRTPQNLSPTYSKEDTNSFIICKADTIKYGNKYEIFQRPLNFKLQGWGMINRNIEVPKRETFYHKNNEDFQYSYSPQYRNVHNSSEDLTIKKSEFSIKIIKPSESFSRYKTLK